jgi:hypothetical protein
MIGIKQFEPGEGDQPSPVYMKWTVFPFFHAAYMVFLSEPLELKNTLSWLILLVLVISGKRCLLH